LDTLKIVRKTATYYALKEVLMDWTMWEGRFALFLDTQMAGADGAHDRAHILRVVTSAKRLAVAAGADLAVVVPAAWLHDCVVVAKDSPDRSRASVWAGETAVAYLADAGYPSKHLPAIEHAIAAHSFSAGIVPQTLEAQVVQDADRLDALGAIGIARCILTGAHMGISLYNVEEAFPEERMADDTLYSVDHFYVKLLKLAAGMQTAVGRAEAERRTQFMERYLAQLREEIEEQGS
jgi:uncharacterized protein